MLRELPPLGEEPECDFEEGCLAWPWHVEAANDISQRDIWWGVARKYEYDGKSDILIQGARDEAKDYDIDAQMSLNHIRGIRDARKLCFGCPYNRRSV